MKTSSRNLSQRLVLYGVGAGAVTIAAAAAGKHLKSKNKIIYSGPEEFSGDTIFFDLQNVTPPSSSFMSNDDFKLKSNCGKKGTAKIKGKGEYTPQIATYGPRVSANASGPRAVMINRQYAIEFHAGDTIGGQNFYGTAYLDYDGDGPWQPGDRGFLGLKITIDCQDYYGWADVTLNTLNCEDGPIFTLHSYAINTEPDESIAAGEKKTKMTHLHLAPTMCTPTPTPTPPVPSAGAMISLLIAGASGVTSLKKSKNSLPV